MTDYNVFHRIAFNWMIPMYFFLGGLSAGAFFISVYAAFWNNNLKPLAKPAAFIVPVSLAVGMGLLTLDLSQPFRFWRLLVTFQPSSMASWGTWALSIFMIISIVYALMIHLDKRVPAKKVGYIGLPFALFTGTYTGLILAQMQGIEIWHSALIPWLFLVGGLVSASGLVVLVALAKGIDIGPFAGLRRFIMWLITLDLVLIITELLVLANGGSQSAEAFRILVAGNYSFGFYVIQILLGILVPLYILASKTKAKSLKLQAVAAMMILVGVFTMRYLLIMVGQIASVN